MLIVNKNLREVVLVYDDTEEFLTFDEYNCISCRYKKSDTSRTRKKSKERKSPKKKAD